MTEFFHTVNIPAELVRELGLSDSMVELKIKDDSIMIKKIGISLEHSVLYVPRCFLGY